MFFNILWAELSEFEITILFVLPTSKKSVRVSSVNYPIEKSDRPYAHVWISKLLDRAYGKSQRQKRIKVLINPAGGTGNAQKWFTQDIEPILVAAQCKIDVERTQYQGHARDIAEKLDIDSYDVIAACSGDGLPHEIFNGLGKRRDARRALSKIAVVQLPCGSGNALSWNLNGTDSASIAAVTIVKGLRTPLDLISITQGNKRILSFLSQSYGIVADCDIGTDHLRWMGSSRFTYGFLMRVFNQTIYPCDIAVKVEIATKSQIREHYRKAFHDCTSPSILYDRDQGSEVERDLGLPPLRYGSINDPLPSDWVFVPYPTLGNFWCGNMAYMAPATNVFPASLPSDGFMDLVTVDGKISRAAAIRSMLAAENDTFFDTPHVHYRKILGYRIVPKIAEEGMVSIDGERMPCEPWQAEIHQGLGTVLSRTGRLYEATGVIGRNGDHS